MCLSTCLFVHRPSHVHLSMHLVCLSIRVQILAPKYYQYLKKKNLILCPFWWYKVFFPLWLMIRRTSPLTNYLSDYGLAVNHVPVRGWTRRLVVRLFLSAALGACTSMVASSLAVKRRGNLNYLILLRWVMNLFVTQLLTNTQNYGQQTEVFTPFSLGGRTNKRRMRNVH